MKLKKDQSGMIMVEAVYVVIITMTIVLFTANFAALYHNRIVLTSVANETANAIAEIYGSTSKEPRYAYTGPGSFYGNNVYRYMNHDKIQDIAEKKGRWYGSYLLYESEWANHEHANDGTITDSFDELNVTCTENDLGLYEITVSINKTYPAFLLFPAKFLGYGLEYNVEAEGKAICYDIIHQMNSMALVKELQNKVDSSFSLLDSIDKIMETISTLMKL